MSSTRIALITLGSIFGGAAIGAGMGAATGAAGAGILTAAGYAGHDVTRATQMTAAGSALFNSLLMGAGGLYASVAHEAGIHETASNNRGATGCGLVVGYTANQVLAAMIGYGLFMAAASDAANNFGGFVADAAVGASVTAIPMSIALLCCVILLGGTIFLATAHDRKKVPVDLEKALDEQPSAGLKK